MKVEVAVKVEAAEAAEAAKASPVGAAMRPFAEYLPREMAAHLAWTFDAGALKSLSTRVVYLVGAQTPHDVLRVLTCGDREPVVVERLDVPQLLDALEREVRHPQLFALVHVRRAAVQVQHGGQRLRRLTPVLPVVAEARKRLPRR